MFMKITICLILVRFIHEIQFFDPVNKQVISKMKNEFKGKIIRGHSKSAIVEEAGEGGGGVIEKQTKTNMERGVPSMCVRSLKKNAEIFKMKFYIVILQFFLLIIMTV